MMRRGWYGNSQGHAYAARGIKTRTYASQKLVDPIFFAQKNERDLPTAHMIQMIRDDLQYDKIRMMHPEVDAEMIRNKGIKVIDMQAGNRTLSTINNHGVDMNVMLAKRDEHLKNMMLNTLRDPQKRSFIAEVKADALMRRLEKL